MGMDRELAEVLRAHGQDGLDVSGWSEAACGELLARLASVDWEMLELWKRPQDAVRRGRVEPCEGLSVAELAARREEFAKIGRPAVRDGKVAAVLLAGGQGTRLGWSGPKGTFNVGVTHPLYIFELLVRNLLAACEECGGFAPLFVMTSEGNDAETRAFFAAHGNFGYPSDKLRFFVQDTAPCVDLSGKLLLESEQRAAFSPNGNGGWYSSLVRTGIPSEFPGTEWYNVFSVDNVLQRIADPVFVGATIASGAKCGAKVVGKTCPEERVGVLCLEDGLPSVIEYYELPQELADARDEKGELVYRYGVTLNYLFHAGRLAEIAGRRIPVHVVKKKIPFVNAAGERVEPERENGYKFETLILDMVRLMGSCLACEVERGREFAPVKNKTGVDSVDSARALLTKNGVEL